MGIWETVKSMLRRMRGGAASEQVRAMAPPEEELALPGFEEDPTEEPLPPAVTGEVEPVEPPAPAPEEMELPEVSVPEPDPVAPQTPSTLVDDSDFPDDPTLEQIAQSTDFSQIAGDLYKPADERGPFPPDPQADPQDRQDQPEDSPAPDRTLSDRLASVEGRLPDPSAPKLLPDHPKVWWRIVSNEGSGEYTVRKQEWSGSALQDITDETDVDYGEDRTAYHHLGAVELVANQIVPGWWIYVGGERVLLIGSSATGAADNPVDILPTGANFETETAQTDTWDREDQGANDGVTMRLTMRIAYDNAGDEKLYAFYRQFKFDSSGNLKTISAETRKEIDEPGPC